MAHSKLRLLLLGLLFHVAFIPLVFDCYFTSPIVHGMQSFGFPEWAPAKRVVLIVADGLRADLLFNKKPFPNITGSPTYSAPYLRQIMKERGSFGVSHTRVPTESRPGHVALIGGLYEDVSAVTKGWKTNPVDFDSVFNRSSATFSFGSPDIIPMFANGATPGKVRMWTYDPNEEDFTKDATALDWWSFKQLESLFHNSTKDKELLHTLKEPQVIFFLHLLGLDTTGHAYRPHSKEYMKNIEVVDDIVRKTEAAFENFYKDKGTAFILTSDHGMSNIGNHGDGDPANTRTPLISWGAGIRLPVPNPRITTHDSYSHNWGISSHKRVDCEQADIAPMISALIGTQWPVNSVGVLPEVTKPEGHLRITIEDRAHLAVVNTKVILEQYRVKHRQKMIKTIRYKPFPGLKGLKRPGEGRVQFMEQTVKKGQWTQAMDQAYSIIQDSLKGLQYLQTYDRVFLTSLATAGYTGWAAYAGVYILGGSESTSSSMFITILASAALAALFGVNIAQSSPLTYYIYSTFPVFFWHEVFQKLLNSSTLWINWSSSGGGRKFLWELIVLGSLGGMVAGYTNRAVWSIGFVLLGLVWPVLSFPGAYWKENGKVVVLWAVTCLCCAVFPIMSVEKTEDIRFILLGGALMVAVGVVGAGTAIKEVLNQIISIVVTVGVTYSSVSRLQAREGLPQLNKNVAWTVLGGSIINILVSRKSISQPQLRILQYFLAFAPVFVILSISVEGLFYTLYSATLYLWSEIERTVAKSKRTSTVGYRTLGLDDLRIALFFLFFTQVAFFGTGNVASVSSFYLEPVYRLVPIFRPFTMAAFLLLKIVTPYVVLSAVLAKLNHDLGLEPYSLFTLALALTDAMTLAFFFQVKDEGSWLEIGQTISFFIISSLLSIWNGAISAAGQWLMAGSLKTARELGVETQNGDQS